ncbi:MAG: hypothetical protein MMC33_003415 [Icmadophila ericetorum]|nr:hypothetical protein [Icmadophila ericetorum]
MSWFQKSFTLPSRSRGSYLITPHVISNLPEISTYKVGILLLFIQHTSCALSLNENYDEDVRADMSDALDRLVPEDVGGKGIYRHDAEGSDDMPDGRKPAIERGELYEAEVKAWLFEDYESIKVEHGYSGGLRLLFHKAPIVFDERLLGNTTMGLKRETFTSISTLLNLHPSYLRAVSQDTGLYKRFDMPAGFTGYIVKPPSGTVEFANGAYTHNTKTGFRHNVAKFVESFTRILEKSAAWAADPLLPALTYAEWQAGKLCDQRLKFSSLLLKAEREAGHTVHNLIAQADSNSNTSIARDSKAIALASQHDSASMKTIAVLTTAFLPGTWVAAFFAVPLFNWNAGPDEQVLNGRFWVYWAVTLPLTAIVMGAWWAWMVWRQNRDRAEKQSGIASIGRVTSDEKDFLRCDGKA